MTEPNFRALAFKALYYLDRIPLASSYPLAREIRAALDDRDGQTCTKCGAGHYTETSIYDDWDGLLHCNNKECNHEVKRYKSEDEPKPEPEPQEVFVSSKTQAVIDAYEETADKYKALAAVIRALVNQGDCIYDPEADYQPVGIVRDSFSLAIADELEAL
jgi:hypothetical protein